MIAPRPPAPPRPAWGVTLGQELAAAEAAMRGAGATEEEIGLFLSLLKQSREKGG